MLWVKWKGCLLERVYQDEVKPTDSYEWSYEDRDTGKR